MSELASKGNEVVSMVSKLAEYTEAPQSFCDELEDTIEKYVDEVAQQEEKQRELRERVDELESSHEITQQSLWSLEDIVLGDWGISNPRFNDQSLVDQIDDVEDQLQASDPMGKGVEEGCAESLVDTIGTDWTPVERNSLMDDDELKDHCGPSDRRATILFKNWDQWCTKVMDTRSLKTCDNLKSLLSAACDEQLSWKQTYRACRHLEQLSKGAIVFTDHSKHGKMLKQTRPFASKQQSDSLPSSSAAT